MVLAMVMARRVRRRYSPPRRALIFYMMETERGGARSAEQRKPGGERLPLMPSRGAAPGRRRHPWGSVGNPAPKNAHDGT